MKKWKIIAIVQVCIILFAAFSKVLSQPDPPCMQCGWNPFEQISESGGSLQVFYNPGEGCLTLHVRFEDREGNPRREFYGDDMIYLYLCTNASNARFAIYEWYPPGSTPTGHWLIWGKFSGPGVYEFGPFWPEVYEPEGIHSWEIWLLDLGTGELKDVVERFDYQGEPPPADTDNDGVPDSQDNCPNHYNPDQKDADNDGIGDVCDPIIDTDNDGVPDSQDNCPKHYNPDQKDADNDGIGDVCDPIIDTDNDGVPDSQDNCPNHYNPDQKDADNDRIGDVCDPIIDTDNDGVPDSEDNCPKHYNPDQKDADNDGIGDVCDPTDDRIGLILVILFIALATTAAVIGITVYRRREN